MTDIERLKQELRGIDNGTVPAPLTGLHYAALVLAAVPGVALAFVGLPAGVILLGLYTVVLSTYFGPRLTVYADRWIVVRKIKAWERTHPGLVSIDTSKQPQRRLVVVK